MLHTFLLGLFFESRPNYAVWTGLELAGCPREPPASAYQVPSVQAYPTTPTHFPFFLFVFKFSFLKSILDVTFFLCLVFN